LAENKPTKRGYGFRPKKRLGQHFLKDTEIVREIISKARFNLSDQVLEIGAGLGALTLPLAGSVHQIVAVEKDPSLTDILRKRLSLEDINNVSLVNDDILKLDFKHIPHSPEKKIKVIGNLPYNISSPFLEKLVENRNMVSRAILMFQFELARRLVANPGNREFGAMTVLIQYHAHLSPLLDVPKESFHPRPKVNSMVLELDFERPHPRRAEDEAKFKMVVKAAFAHRRKTLLNSLKRTLSSHSSEEILAALEKCDIDPGRRAETLEIDDFLCLTSALPSLS
jgi:16S rRNA (adenine1518-N6/adenine1519-N6)-dimethyltransferase